MRRTLIASTAAVLLVGCTSPDPKATLVVSNVETYYAIDKQVGEELYLAATIRFEIKNVGTEPLDYVLGTATFKRKGFEHVDWGTAFERITPPDKPALAPGATLVYWLKSDTRYFSTGRPESMFEHKEFRDVIATLFLRVGSSGWVEFAKAEVPRQIGAKSVAEPPPAASPSTTK
ncbi:MAG: hypothetical protein NDJ94_02510 [Vicinamibacteria bacterium]|nr:hypothetical protein [Vicinamibacteria bacterium]